MESYNLTDSSWVEYFTEIDENVKISESEFEYLWDLHPKERNKSSYGGYKRRRFEQAYGFDYNFSGKVHKSLEIPPFIQKYIDYTNQTYVCNLNTAFVNWYFDGNDTIQPHADKMTEIVEDSPIFCYSFGAERKFQMKNNTTQESLFLNLKNNSLVIMGGTCQKTHKHSINPTKKDVGRRISITLREFKR